MGNGPYLVLYRFRASTTLIQTPLILIYHGKTLLNLFDGSRSIGEYVALTIGPPKLDLLPLTKYAQIAIGYNPQPPVSVPRKIHFYSQENHRIHVAECHAVAMGVSHPEVLASASCHR